MNVKLGFLFLFLLCLGFSSEVAAQDPSVIGRWSRVPDLPFFPVHTHVLPTGKVMIWPGDLGISGNDPRLWDPATATTSFLTPPGYDLFCSGHAFLADGRLFVAGGHIQNGVGLPNASAYDPFTNLWTRTPNMNAGRWYPTTTTLANGDMLVVSGSINTTVGENLLPEVFQAGSGTWRDLTNAQISLDLYPRMYLAPNGRVFNSSPSTVTRYLNTSGTGSWTVVANRSVNVYRDYDSSVMYGDGKVLVVGGGDPPTNTAEVIDLNAASPAWRSVAPMASARRQLNATLLPDGKVLVTGGTSGPGFNNTDTAVFAAELWDPATENWTTMATAQIPRLYHSAVVLLPDGRLLSTGGNGYTQTEIYEPPYLFKGARPTINSAPATVSYGQTFFVETANAASITQVTWIRLSSVTHSFNMNQRINRLSFSQVAGGLNVVAPSNANLAPPGHYMLFILNGNGVPSVAKIIQITSTADGAGTLQFSAATYNVAENGGNATITITRTGGSAGAVGVTFATSNGTATAGSDYTAVSQTVSFANGDTANKTVSIPILDDTSVEPNETVNLALSSPTGGSTLGSPSTAVLTITDNDGGTTLSASPTTVAPGGTITATWSGIANPTTTDWIGLYTIGAANTAYIHWIYVSCSQNPGAAQASGSCPFTVPTSVAPGTYQLRLLANNGYTLLAISNNFTVGVGGGAGTLQFSAATYTVAENGGNATITITRTGGSAGAVGVTFATSNGTATAGSDYTAVSQTVSFANGDTANKTVSIPIVNDTSVEPNEMVNLALSSPTGGATLGSPSTAVLTITDNDAAPAGTLQFSAATYSVAENGGNATITVTRTGGSAGAVGVTFATSNGTATAPSDYTATSQTVSFANGDTANKTVNIPIVNDTSVEPNETINLALSTPTGGATLGSPSTAVLTITDNDTAPAGSLQFSAATYSVAENGGNATITVTRTGGSAGAVGVTFATSNGTATAPSDYTATSQTVSFANGDTANKTVSIPIVNDTSVEPNETVNLALSTPTGGATLGSPSTAVLTITDNDGGTTLSASPTTIAPGGTITATWSGIANPTTTDWIGLYTIGAANTAYIHWIYVSCSQSAGAAQASGSCPFVVPSTVAPGTYHLRLLANDGFTLLATSNNLTVAVGGGAGSLQFSAATYSVAENGGNATITVTRTGGSAGAVGVTFATSNGTATAPSDYTATSQTVSFANGDTANKTVNIPIVNDTSVEPNETVNLALSSPTGGATLGSPSTAVLTITDNDGGVTLGASPTTVAPGGMITAAWSGIAAPTTRDWIGLYTPGAANTAYIHWIYVSCSQNPGAAQASGSCPFIVPSTVAPGTYHLRLLANDGFTLVATSNNFTVQ